MDLSFKHGIIVDTYEAEHVMYAITNRFDKFLGLLSTPYVDLLLLSE